MVLHKGAGLPLELPNGHRCVLPGYCNGAEATEIVKFPGPDGDAFAVGVKVVEREAPTPDPREKEGFGEFIEFNANDKMGDFMAAFCKEGFRVATLQVGWKRGTDGKLHNANMVANDMEEATDVSECLPVLVPNGLLFIVDRNVHGQVQYTASAREIGFFDNGDGAFIPSSDVQEHYRKNLAEGMSIPDARKIALAHTNSRLQEFTDWCNGKVYGVLNYCFDAHGQPLGDGEEVWGILGSGDADKELAKRLFEQRVAAKAQALGLDPSQRQITRTTKADFIGAVLEVDASASIAIQSTGRGAWVAHHLGDLKSEPAVGDVLEVHYRNAKVVMAKNHQENAGQVR